MRLLLPLLCLAVLLSACAKAPVNAGPQDIALLGPNGTVIMVNVEVADEADEWSQGLSNREEPLMPDHGMLFVFPQPDVLSFWMKDTKFPLDILFFDGAGKVATMTTMTPCEADPCPTYSSGKPSALALEVPAGFVKEHGITTGWQLALPAKK